MLINMNRKKALLLSFAFLFLIPYSILSMTKAEAENYYLQIYLLKENEVYWETKVNKNDTFYHEYIHSVELSPVREYYFIVEQYSLVAQESWTKSFGAGLPTEKKREIEFKDGFMVIRDERPIEYINMQSSHLFPHYLYVGKEQVELSSQYLSGKPFRIRVLLK